MRPPASSLFGNVCSMLSLLRLDCCAVEEIKFTRELADVKLTAANQTATFECELSKAGLKVGFSCSCITAVQQLAY